MHKASESVGGVGENRTLVQTSNQRAFYTFILFLFFRLQAGYRQPTYNLSSLVSNANRSALRSILTFTMPLIERR